MKLKKAFTLIELLITLFLASILLWFAFSYQFNFLKEVKYLEDREYLARETFIFSEYLTKGVTGIRLSDNEKEFLPGLISLRAYNSGTGKYYVHENLYSYRYLLNQIIAGTEYKFVLERHIYFAGTNYYRYFFYDRLDIEAISINNVNNLNNVQTDTLFALELNTSHNTFEYNVEQPEMRKYTRLIYRK